jgi:hypothetical protein
VSSDWDDWQDPEYIADQRKALQDFAKKQREIKSSHQGKKKKKKKGKKKKGQTAGDAIDAELDELSNDNFRTVKDDSASVLSDDGEVFEEEKVPHKQNDISKTRVGEIDRSSIDHVGIMSKS